VTYVIDDDVDELLMLSREGQKNPKLSIENIEVVFIPILRELSEIALKQSKSLGSFAKKVSPLNKPVYLVNNLKKGTLFMDRYLITNVTLPPDSFRVVTLDVVDQIPPKRPLLIRLLLVVEFDPRSLSRNFMRESALLSEIDHKFVPRLITFGETKDYLYQIYEAHKGVSLAYYMENKMGQFGFGETNVILLLLGIIEGLDVLHEKKVVHTSIRPENIIVNENNFSDVKLVSWELASWDTRSLYGHTVNILEAYPSTRLESRSIHFVAPEQMRRDFVKAAPSGDLYSLGAVAFSLITGFPPLVGIMSGPDAGDFTFDDLNNSMDIQDMDPELYEEIISKKLPDIRQTGRTCDDLINVLDRMLERNPEDRISSAALKEQLEELLGHLNSIPPAMRECLPHLAPDEDMSNAPNMLDLRNEIRTDFMCRYLAKFAEDLVVSSMRITGGVIPLDIIKHPETTSLKLRNLNLASHDIMVIATAMEPNSALTSLDLYDNFIASKSDQQPDVPIVPATANGEELAPSGGPVNQATYEIAGLRRLALAIQRMPLQVLDLSKNAIGREGGVLIGQTVEHLSKTLETLKLAFCHIMPQGGLAIAQALYSMTEMKTLDLSHCYIGDTGTMAVARALEQSSNSKLECLSLFGNNIDNEGGTSLMATLESNFTLLSLSLGDNAIPEVHNRVVQRAIGFNNQYLSLKLRNDKFDGFGHNLMAESLKTWGRGNMFIAQRLLYRLQRPRDALEESVAKILLSKDGEYIVLD